MPNGSEKLRKKRHSLDCLLAKSAKRSAHLGPQSHSLTSLPPVKYWAELERLEEAAEEAARSRVSLQSSSWAKGFLSQSKESPSKAGQRGDGKSSESDGKTPAKSSLSEGTDRVKGGFFTQDSTTKSLADEQPPARVSRFKQQQMEKRR